MCIRDRASSQIKSALLPIDTSPHGDPDMAVPEEYTPLLTPFPRSDPMLVRFTELDQTEKEMGVCARARAQFQTAAAPLGLKIVAPIVAAVLVTLVLLVVIGPTNPGSMSARFVRLSERVQ
eukprot:TRINITY_DN57186_c0_g1_i2.p2 TRINITY_DN57186_c0_g1~~TRINITY_DN57186_c0_g1_i2.p2  ORF type:complete len:121 (+),score=35.23 TRINITY_DN57186_c0_g1_i2:135-497(+)